MSWVDSCDLEYALADLKAENERLQAENEKLRKELAVDEPLFETLNTTNDGLISENAKLRELARESVLFERHGCYGCAHEDICDPQLIYDEECARRQGIEQSMRELGIEVDE